MAVALPAGGRGEGRRGRIRSGVSGDVVLRVRRGEVGGMEDGGREKQVSGEGRDRYGTEGSLHRQKRTSVTAKARTARELLATNRNFCQRERHTYLDSLPIGKRRR